jgi:nuclear pore complex protein Nup133
MRLLFVHEVSGQQFPSSVVILSLCAIDSDYQDRLELKWNNNRTLGFGVISSTNALLILTATTMMKIKLDLDVIQAFHAEWIMNSSVMWMRGAHYWLF